MKELNKKSFNRFRKKYRIISKTQEIRYVLPLQFNIIASRDVDNFKEYPYKLYNLYCIYWWLITKISIPYFKITATNENLIKHLILANLYPAYQSANDFTNLEEMASTSLSISRSIKKENYQVSILCELLELKKEIKYYRDDNNQQLNSGYYITNEGVKVLHEKKYINEEKEITWKKRNRWFSFLNGPLMLVLTLISTSVAVYQYNNNESLEKRYKDLYDSVQLIKKSINKHDLIKNKRLGLNQKSLNPKSTNTISK